MRQSRQRLWGPLGGVGIGRRSNCSFFRVGNFSRCDVYTYSMFGNDNRNIWLVERMTGWVRFGFPEVVKDRFPRGVVGLEEENSMTIVEGKSSADDKKTKPRRRQDFA